MRVFETSLKYNKADRFIVNKQFDGKTFCVVALYNKSESVLATGFRTKKQATQWANAQFNIYA